MISIFNLRQSDQDMIFQGIDGGSAINALRLDMSAAGAATFNDKITAVGTSVFTNLDISGDVDIDGTLEADAITVNGTALASVIAGTTVTLASTVTVTDSTANTNFPVVFHDESNALLDDTGALRYNPSTGELLVPKLTVAGTTTTVDTVTMNAENAIVFEGATADAHETTLTIIDPTGDRTINLPNVSGTIPVLAAVSATAITSTPAELNILDGVTSTAAELNVLDGITAVVGELNALDLGSTAVGTAIASKAVILDSNKDYTGFRNITLSGELDAGSLDVSGDVDIDGTLETDALSIASTTVTATAAELNFTDGVTSNIQTQLNTKTTPGFALAMAVAL
jgi:cytoskeletal protein CcmA (bactofilin family)